MGNRRYSETFKENAVRLVREGATVQHVAKQTGASVYSLRDWVKEAEQAARERPATALELAEMRRLRKHIAGVEQERDILKKAIAFFAKEQA